MVFQLDEGCRGVQKKLRGESGLEENIALITESQDSEAKVSVIWFNHHNIILAHFVLSKTNGQRDDVVLLKCRGKAELYTERVLQAP